MPPGLLSQPAQTPSTPTSAATPVRDDVQSGTMVDADAAAGVKRGASRSPGAAKAIAALRALKHQREGSPSKGMNPNANAFQPLAAAAQSGQQIGDAANFMGTFKFYPAGVLT